MNRSIKQELARRHIRSGYDSHPAEGRRVGDGNAAENALQQNSDTDSFYAIQERADYLPGVSLKRRASDHLHDKPENGTDSTSHDCRLTHPAGDRRMGIEERLNLIPKPSVISAHELPSLSSYVARLGVKVTQAARPQTWPRVFIEQRKPKSWQKLFFEPRKAKVPHDGISSDIAFSAAEQGSHPIGERRVHNHARRGEDAAVSQLPYSVRVADSVEKSLYARVGLRIWSYYFLAKLALFSQGLISFHMLENLVFAIFILVPVNSYRSVKKVITFVLAIALLYHDSWLPPISRIFSQASLLSNFSFAYLIELLARFVSWPVIGLLLAFLICCFILSRWVRIDAVAVAGMVILGTFHLSPAGEVSQKVMPDMDMVMQKFFAQEAQRSVAFISPQPDAAPFDVIFIHVCSMAWDDVLAVGLDQHPLWRHFDILMTRFNSAASYSGPAAIHLMRAKCGQVEHGGMYQPAADKCYLMDSLEHSGFEQNVVLNHDGQFDDFLGQLKTHGRLHATPMSLDGLDAAQYSFDKSAVYDDLSVLNRWLDTRQKTGSARVALYYNTVSMHDGNHLPGTDSAPNTSDNYKVRLSKFLDDLEAFMQKLDQSGRRAVVVMVPEHGAALRGDKKQISGLREIPTPAITIVPVGIKVVGGNLQRVGSTLAIDKPTSYQAISQIIENMLEQSPFTSSSFVSSDYVVNLPITPFVAQNEVTTVSEYDNRYYLGRGVGKWELYSEFNQPATNR